MTEYKQFPTDIEEIKKDIELRQQAIRIMFAEITALQQHLAKALGPQGWLEYQASRPKPDILSEVKKHEEPTAEDRSQWQLNDYLENDTEWQGYLKKGL